MTQKENTVGTRISAIDIGSNAIRMMVGEIDSTNTIRLLKKWRAPLRLGKDVFLSGEISGPTLARAGQTFEKFAVFNRKYRVKHCQACATSAVREARNRQEFVESMRKRSGLEIQIIDGTEEARLIHLAVTHDLHLADRNALLVDIGGGSAEITYSEKNTLVATRSFALGTVRLLDRLKKRKLHESQLNLVIGENISLVTEFFAKELADHQALEAVGTGGNIECLGRLKVQLLQKTPNTYVTAKELGKIIDKLKKISVRERIQNLGLRPDRADVILPAALVLQMILRQAGITKLRITCVGLRDGILQQILLNKLAN